MMFERYAEGVHQLLAPHLEEGTMHPLTLTNEVHAKVVFNDTRNALPSESPMMIWSDVTKLEWEEGQYFLNKKLKFHHLT